MAVPKPNMVIHPILTILLITITTSLAAEPTTSTVEPGDTICRLNENEPEYMPNIYKCSSNERCCKNEGQFSCCSTDISSDAVMEQVILWSCLAAILFLIGIAAYMYFNDTYCCVNKEDEDTTGCLCWKRKRKERYDQGGKVDRVLYPDTIERNEVDDPIFGKRTTADDIPYMAHVDDDIRKKAAIVEVEKRDIV